MKTAFYFTAFAFAAMLTLGSCTDDFLETEARNGYILHDTLKLTGHVEDFTIQLGITEAANSPYTVMIYPKWIAFEEMNGRFSNGITQFRISTANETMFTNQDFTGKIVFDIRDLGYVELVTQYLNP